MKNDNNMKTLIDGFNNYLNEATVEASLETLEEKTALVKNEVAALKEEMIKETKNLEIAYSFLNAAFELLEKDVLSSEDYEAALDKVGSLGDDTDGHLSGQKDLIDKVNTLRGTLAMARNDTSSSYDTTEDAEEEYFDNLDNSPA
jgi:hypothetical protein